jgi:hypothetical protein
MAENYYHTDADTIDYDFENDSLYLFEKGGNYSHSLNLDNIISDIGEKRMSKAWRYRMLRNDWVSQNMH